MMNRNTYGCCEYIGETLFYTFIGFICYKNILFRCINGMSYAQSRIILITLIITLELFGVLINLGRSRNVRSLFANIAFPFGIYATITYISLNKLLFSVVLISPGMLSIICAGITLCRKIKNKKKVKYIIVNRIRNTISCTQFFFALGLTCAMIFIGTKVLFGFSMIQSTVVATSSKELEEQTIENNIDSILLLQENLWEKLSAQKRLDVLQTVVNTERRYLGIPHELNVGVANLGEHTLGHYIEGTHEIIINLDHLMNDDASKVLESVCHEVRHGYQYCLVSVFENSPEDAKNLRLLKDAKSYAKEFSNYKEGTRDYYDYYNQKCEIDARAYAEEAVADYYQRIDEYLTDKGNG